MYMLAVGASMCLLVNVVFAVVSRFAVVTRRNGDLRKLAAILGIVVILASANVTQDSLLIVHNSPPADSVGNLRLGYSTNGGFASAADCFAVEYTRYYPCSKNNL